MEGTLENKPEKIAGLFQKFYTKLYNIQPQHKPPHLSKAKEEIIQDFLKDSNLPSLKKGDRDKLEEPITINELQAAIKDLTPGKSLGPDEFTSQYYRIYAQPLSKQLLATFNYLAKNKNNLNSFLMAYISVIPKPDEEHTDCAILDPFPSLTWT